LVLHCECGVNDPRNGRQSRSCTVIAITLLSITLQLTVKPRWRN